MPYEATHDLAYDTAMDFVDDGYNFACVPVIETDGSKAVWTAALEMPQPRDDLDVLAGAFVAVKAARDEAERHGLHPVP